MKTCTKCQQEKNLEEFGKFSRNNDGLDTQCKSCRKEQRRALRIKQGKNVLPENDPNATEKECGKCKTVKPIARFSPSGKGEGYRSTCRDCRNKHRSDKYAASAEQREKIRQVNRAQRIKQGKKVREEWDPSTTDRECNTCHTVKPLGDFHTKKASIGGHRPVCKDCANAARRDKIQNDPEYRARHLAWKRQWQKDNWEAEYARMQDWRARNPERVKQLAKESRARNRPTTNAAASRRRAVQRNAKTFPSVETYIKSCYGKPCFYCSAPSDTHDHIVPLVRGGDHSEGNIVPACQSCNFSKNDKTVAEWRHGFRSPNRKAA